MLVSSDPERSGKSPTFGCHNTHDVALFFLSQISFDFHCRSNSTSIEKRETEPTRKPGQGGKLTSSHNSHGKNRFGKVSASAAYAMQPCRPAIANEILRLPNIAFATAAYDRAGKCMLEDSGIRDYRTLITTPRDL